MKKTKIAGILALFIVAMMILPYLISCKADEENQLFPDRTDDTTLRIAVYEINGNFEIVGLEKLKKLIYDEYGVNAEITTYPYVFDDDKIATKLLAGDDDFDIYFLQSMHIPYYAKVNALCDLSSSKEIVENFGNMFDGMQDLCSVGDKLCGVPVQVTKLNTIWDCNIELAEQLGIDIAELSTKKMTFAEFYDFAVEMKAKSVEIGMEEFYILSGGTLDVDHRVIDYMTNYLDYTNKTVENRTQEYIDYINLYMKMADEGLIKVVSSWNLRLERDDILFLSSGDFSYLTPDIQPFPKPLISINDSYQIETNILAINPHSPNIEAAKKYLEYSISLPILQKRVFEYFLNDWDLYEYWLPESQLMDINGDILEILPPTIEKREAKTNGHEVVAFLIKNGKRAYFNLDIFNEMRDNVIDLRNGVMTPEDFAQKLYSKCKMIIEE